jgi:hypothetical protein
VPLLGSFEAFLRALKQNVRYRYLLSSDLENVALLRRELVRGILAACGIAKLPCGIARAGRLV